MKTFRRLGRSVSLLALGLAFLGSAPKGSVPLEDLAQNAALRDFESWKELTEGPYKVHPRVWAGCVPPSSQQYDHPGELLAYGSDRFIRVYADPQALPLMRSPRGPKFPVGSKIAKVKLLPGSTRPVSVAFMVKREAGYNPASLDWEFLFFDGQPLRQTALDAGARCQECHGGMVEGDGVYGSYLAERRGTAR
jgi:cytochrome P460